MLEDAMLVRTLLVGTDLSDRADQAIVRGHELAAAGGARLVVCHVGPPELAAHPLFPQQHQRDVLAATQEDAEMAEDVSSRVVELTGRSRENFEVVVDRGQASRALCEQSARVSADLVVVMADRLLEGEAATVTRDLVRGCNCSVLVLGRAAGEAERTPERVAVVALEGEVEFVPELVSAALFVSSKRPPGIDVVLWVAERDVEASAITAQLARQSSDLGMPLAPWFADVRDTTMLMARASRHPSIGLLVILAPPPAELAKSASGPIDDILPEATSSILLLRLGWPVI
jgi:nucleotide-binding universal stress UspA family protein